MAPTASTSHSSALHLASARRATYNKTRKGANKALNWPYPLTAAAARTSSIHPDRLVEAGFYCTPTHDDPTVTTCFLCEIVIGQWEEGEDPLYRHQAAIDEAEIRCGWLDVLSQSRTRDGGTDGGIAHVPRDTWPVIWGGQGAEMHPRGERMTWARLATFRLGWPHEGVRGVPTKEDIAAAGWVFRPGAEEESQDQCACIYCGRTVEGWEEGDDPVALHKRKVGLKCPFFLADDPPPAPKPSAAAKEASTPLHAEENAEAEEEGVEPEPEAVKPKRGSRKTTAGAESTAAKKSTRGTAAAAAAAEKKAKAEPEPEQSEDDPAEGADAEAAAEGEGGEQDDGDDPSDSEPVKPATKATRKGKAVAAKSSSGTAKQKKTARQTTTRSTTRAKATPAVSEAEDAPEEADMSVLRKSTRARAASTASTTSSAVPTRVAALSKSTRSRTAQTAPEIQAPETGVPERAAAPPAVDSSDLEVVKPPKRSGSTKASRKPLVVELSTADETTDADESIAQLARIADAALEAQGPEETVAADPAPPPPPKESKKSKKASSSETASSTANGGSRTKKGKKASAAEEPGSGTATPEEAAKPMAVEPTDDANSQLPTRSAASNGKEAAPPISSAQAPALVASTLVSQPPISARSPLSPTSPGTSSSRPIRALPVNKSSKSPSSGSLAGLSLPASDAAPPVPSPKSALPLAALPSENSSLPSLPTSAFETANERLSTATTATRVDPTAPFTPPANPFGGSTLLSLVPPPTQHELDTLSVAEWYSLCHRRIADRFAAENAAMRAHFEARLEAGRTKLGGMCDEAREREEREAREDDENRRAVAKERKERVAASGGGGGRNAVKAGGGSTRKMR
ncbi:hypothetical protein JCM3774_001247 [Rhodotorula dairenensis]